MTTTSLSHSYMMNWEKLKKFIHKSVLKLKLKLPYFILSWNYITQRYIRYIMLMSLVSNIYIFIIFRIEWRVTYFLPIIRKIEVTKSLLLPRFNIIAEYKTLLFIFLYIFVLTCIAEFIFVYFWNRNILPIFKTETLYQFFLFTLIARQNYIRLIFLQQN